MEMLHKRFGETVNLARLVDGRAVYINILESKEAFRISDVIGDAAPFHATAIGKAIAAFLPKEKRAMLFKNYDFTLFTRKTISGIDSLNEALDEVKKSGSAMDSEEGHDGVLCVGAPIFNNEHYAFAALSISMPKVRARKSVLDEVKEQLPREGIAISLELGVTDIAKCFAA
jgi:IclR family acetate operon transcriptional repressor